MRIDKPTFVKCMNMIKAYKDKLDEAYTEIENVIGDCEKLIEKVDGVDAMIQLLEVACCDDKFIQAYVYDTYWGEWDTVWTDDNGREFPFKTIDHLWEVMNYVKPWELKLVLC